MLVFYPAKDGATSANCPLDPFLPGRLRLSDAERQAGRGTGMRGHVFIDNAELTAVDTY
ncbi:hypothetical protein [Thiomonas sp. FB-Cd]|uniref:hypothetical protein n=1 Tax=Thiomonas sp. FB-Cd TaxID=1158292 RepID=UPI000A928152|nr:hypothetical protein [Thiomonas sp. FB-Cd]